MFENHKICVLQFSGGKDSLACLYLLKKYWDKIHVVWMNTGASYPETIEQMKQIKQLVPHFHEVKSDQPAWIKTNGYPVDLLPLDNTRFGANFGKTNILLQSWGTCCLHNIWLPLQDYTKGLGATLIIRGQKECDVKQSPLKSGNIVDGIEYYFPLETWTEKDVLDYLAVINVDVPTYYRWSDTSLDCWDCTAFLSERQKEISNLKTVHPDMWDEVLHRLNIISRMINTEREHLMNLIGRQDNAL